MTIRVVTSRSWVARELASNTVEPVEQSFGLDLPESVSRDDGWWMPAEHAARVVRQLPLRLTAPGPRWLTDLPEALRGREVLSFTVADWLRELHDTVGDGGWCKPAEAKIEAFPAAWRTPDELAALLAETAMPPDSWVQWCPQRLDLAAEFRCYVLDGQVAAHSLYLTTDRSGRQTTYYDGAACDTDTDTDALAFARTAAQQLWHIGGAPSAYCIDVGYDRASGRWLVIEANPAWCSAWYGCDIDAVATTILAACRPSAAEHNRWGWRPDAYLTARAARMLPLPARTR